MDEAATAASVVAMIAALALVGMIQWGWPVPWLWGTVAVMAGCMAVCVADALFGPDEGDEEGADDE